MKPYISIIIPTFNEEAVIGKLLTYLQRQSTTSQIKEIIVVDGGSVDRTIDIAAAFDQVETVISARGRARQMNVGAAVAKGDILYFLHADTFPPLGFDQKIIQAIQDQNVGCFRLKFENPHHFLLKIAPWFTQFHSLLFRGGDQSLFILKKDFEALGRFDERYTIYEDVEFIHRIYKSDRDFKILDDYVLTSARKFKRKGTLRLFLHFWMIHMLFALGRSPKELFAYYQKNIRL